MFHDVPEPILRQMKYLEELDARHRREEVGRDISLRQIPPDSGKFLALLAAGSPEGTWLELGTSGGYSALWLSLAARYRQKKLVTVELLESKFQLAQETFKQAGIEDLVEQVEGDAREVVKNHNSLSFCFLDIEKDMYLDCYEPIIAGLVPGGILAADNAISRREMLTEFLDAAARDDRADSLIVPIDRGILISRKI